jgi:hypothetical protein
VPTSLKPNHLRADALKQTVVSGSLSEGSANDRRVALVER